MTTDTPRIFYTHDEAQALIRFHQAHSYAAPMPPDAPADPAYGVELTADDDLRIDVDDRVIVFLPGAYEPRTATVKAVRGDGQYLVHFAFGCTRWVWGQDIVLRVKAAALDGEAAAVGEAG